MNVHGARIAGLGGKRNLVGHAVFEKEPDITSLCVPAYRVGHNVFGDKAAGSAFGIGRQRRGCRFIGLGQVKT